MAARATGLAALAAPFVALAQAPPLPTPPFSTVDELIQVGGPICTIFTWLFFILILVAVIFILLAGYKYVVAGGDAEKVKGANRQILFAAVAVVIAFVARVVPNIALGLIGSGTTGAQC